MWIRTLCGVVGAVSAALVGTHAFGQEVFGSRLNHQLTPPQFCVQANKAKICSWVLEIGQNNAARTRAPRDGVIGKIRLMACKRGTFVLQIARASPPTDSARVVRSGPLINYVGATRNCNASSNFTIEEFTVNVPVKRNDFLAVVANEVAFLYNASGDGSILFDPPLPDGGPMRPASDVDGDGFLMIQAELNPPT